jgi:hypothetical protein
LNPWASEIKAFNRTYFDQSSNFVEIVVIVIFSKTNSLQKRTGIFGAISGTFRTPAWINTIRTKSTAIAKSTSLTQ